MRPTILTRLRAQMARRDSELTQFVIFSIIGTVATAVYLLGFNLLRDAGLGAFGANALSVVVSTALAFVANRRFTFPGARERRALPQSLEFFFVVFVTILLSSLALWLLFRLWTDPGRLAENVALLASTGAMFVVRFVVMSRWVFDPARAKP